MIVGYKYYSFYNDDPLASLTFSLSTVSGDADLYVTTYIESNVTVSSSQNYYYSSYYYFSYYSTSSSPSGSCALIY